MRRITVIDDNQETQNFLRELLVQEGWDVVSWQQGTNAFNLVQEAQPQLVILDLRLETPEKGWQILRQLKSDASTRDIPVVVCSADTWALHSHETLLNEYAAAVLVKPFTIDDVYRCIEHTLPSAKS